MKTFKLQKGDAFLVLATDGLWDVFSSEDLVQMMGWILDQVPVFASKCIDNNFYRNRKPTGVPWPYLKFSKDASLMREFHSDTWTRY